MEFEVVGRESVYQGRAFNVEKIQARLPDGNVRPYDLVDHRDSVTVIPLDQQGNLWFVTQYRIGAQQELLELPAGVLEHEEDPSVGAAREIREETGQAAAELILLGDFYLTPGYCNEHMYVYLALGLYADPLDPDADEFLQVRTIPAVEAYAMAERGEIHDSKTLASLMLARQRILAK